MDHRSSNSKVIVIFFIFTIVIAPIDVLDKIVTLITTVTSTLSITTIRTTFFTMSFNNYEVIIATMYFTMSSSSCKIRAAIQPALATIGANNVVVALPTTARPTTIATSPIATIALPWPWLPLTTKTLQYVSIKMPLLYSMCLVVYVFGTCDHITLIKSIFIPFHVFSQVTMIPSMGFTT